MANVRLSALFAATLLSACGGGGGNPGNCNASDLLCNPPPSAPSPVQPPPGPAPAPTPPPPSPPAPGPGAGPTALRGPEGFWTGSTNTGRVAYVYVQEDGTVWMMYSGAGNPYVLAGVGFGRLASTTTSFVGDGVDVNVEGLGVSTGAFSGTYTAGANMDGMVQFTNSRLAYSATFDPAYLQKPDLSLLAGTFSAPVTVGTTQETVTTAIRGDGTISGVSMPSGCTFAGTIAPRITGNAFATKITFGGPPCLAGRSTFDGIAIYNGPAGQIVSAALNSSKTAGFFMLAIKQ